MNFTKPIKQENATAKHLSAKMKSYGDNVFWSALTKLDKSGMPLEVIFDRMGTCFAAHCVLHYGKSQTADVLRHMASQVENGAFDAFSGESKTH